MEDSQDFAVLFHVASTSPHFKALIFVFPFVTFILFLVFNSTSSEDEGDSEEVDSEEVESSESSSLLVSSSLSEDEVDPEPESESYDDDDDDDDCVDSEDEVDSESEEVSESEVPLLEVSSPLLKLSEPSDLTLSLLFTFAILELSSLSAISFIFLESHRQTFK